MSEPDTIIALSSPAGAGRRAVLRLSGPAALEALAEILPDPDALRGTWVQRSVALEIGDGWPSIPAAVFVMRAPRSYTREDVGELHLSGSPAIVHAVLRRLTRRPDVRAAEPGEFTRRAYLSGRLDAAQVAAVLDLVRARHLETARAAAAVLGGEPSQEVAALRAALLRLVARVEAHLDFTDDDAAQLSRADIWRDLETARERCRRCLGSLVGRSHDESIRLALIGAPNAGKTSLFNRLTGQIGLVSEQPGTTRDVGEATIEVDGWRLSVWDTAGWRETTDELELRSRSLAQEAAERADLRFEILDGTAEQMPDLEQDWAADALVIHKVDLPARLDLAEVHRRAAGRPVLQASAKTGFGLDALVATARVLAESGAAERSASAVQLVAGHRDTLELLLAGLDRVAEQLGASGELELAAFELREALDHLEALGAPVRHDEVLDVLFRQFCIGK